MSTQNAHSVSNLLASHNAPANMSISAALTFDWQWNTRPWHLIQQGLKRIGDFVLALIGLIGLLPLFLGIALAIKLTSPGPVFYKSPRIGKDFEPFSMYKFRTMRPDADNLRDGLREKAELHGELFKLKNDPRITTIGRFLRASSLDELPQLINVLLGHMSLVGPRPLPPDESALFEEPYTVRFAVLPGITGKWQVSGRSSLSFEEMCSLEWTYVKQWSLWQDVHILLLTIPAVVLRKGAY